MTIREFCKRYHLSLIAVMEIANVSRIDLIRYSRGDKKVSKEALKRINALVDVVEDNNLINSYEITDSWSDRRAKFKKYKETVRSLMEDYVSNMGDKKKK